MSSGAFALERDPLPDADADMIERRLIDAAMLSADELGWLNCYHAHVLAKIGPRLSGEDLAWLQRACAPIGEAD